MKIKNKIFANKKELGGGYFTNLLNKDLREINKIYLSLISVGIICLGIYLGINITKTSYALFSASIKGEKTIEVVVDTLLNKTTIFNYTGTSQEYEVPKDGYYYIELAGAQGGGPDLSLGAKTSGYIYLEQGEKLYFYVGQKGTDSNTNCRSTGYEFNGGGIAKPARSGICGPSGGGATDVRLVGGSWDDTSSLISRIMVAGAGGGRAESSTYTQGYGGTLYGGDPIFSTYQSNIGNGGTQTGGGAAPTKGSSAQSNGTAGSFGKGGFGGASHATNADTGGGSGGGSGYYGGSGASGLSNGTWPGGGGSSYISGYAGVNSVEESTSIKHTNQTLHYSGKYFIGGKMLADQNEGNGYAKITYVREKPEKKTTKLDNVRYIKNCISYNSANNQNHWDEIQAIYEGENIAKGKSVTGTYPEANSTTYSYKNIVDGTIDSESNSGFGYGSSNSKNQCVTVDLGKEYDLDEIAVWNYFGDQRRYYDNVTSVSSDNKDFTEIIDEASIETSNGHRINAYTDTYNGYIQDSLVLWYDGNSNTSTHSYNSTTWKDLSGTGYNGTVSGATWYDKYLSFDGVNDTVLSNVLTSTLLPAESNRTLEIILKINSVPYSGTNGNSGVLFGGARYGGMAIFWSTNIAGKVNIRGYTRTAINEVETAFKVFDYPTDIINLTYVNDSTSNLVKTYLNGVYIDSMSSISGSYSNSSNIGNVGINKAQIATSSYTASYANMNVYSARIYTKALTEEEILHNYNYDKEKFNLE